MWTALLGVGCQPAGPPNIIVVALDTLRADRVGVYGSTAGLTPNIDELAADSVVFDRAYSQSTETLFSFGSMFTGRYPSELGPSTYEWRIPADVPVLPEVLHTYGYAAAAFVAGGQLRVDFGLDRGWDPYVVSEREFASLGMTRDPALEWMEHAHAPFFALVHGYDMHQRYWKPSPLGSALPDDDSLGRRLALHAHGSDAVVGEDAVPLPCIPIIADGNASVQLDAPNTTKPLVARCVDGSEVLEPSDEAVLRDAYDGAARWVDAEVGVLLASLEDEGHFEDSWIILLADHGEALGEAGRFGHHDSMTTDVVHVPLMVRPPGGTAGRHVAGMVELTDVTATVFDIAGATPPARMRGHSLVGVVRGAEDTGRHQAVTESVAQMTRITSDRGTHLTFRGIAWDNPTFPDMLAWAPGDGPSFKGSDVPDDGELNRLRAALGAWYAGIERGPEGSKNLDPAYKEALRAGGYWTP